MFDIGFAEFVLVFVIGLLVLGPQRLPKVAAEIGKWVGRARRTANDLRRQLEREIELSEMVEPPPVQPPPAPPPPEFTSDAGIAHDGAPPEPHTSAPMAEPPAADSASSAPSRSVVVQEPASTEPHAERAPSEPHAEPVSTEQHSPQPPEPVAHSSKP
jgi:sec-independent protein translocase protein TatB